jgi:hypothetical protein
MKLKQLVLSSVVALGLQGVAHATTYPSDAEASFDLPAFQTYADQQMGAGTTGVAWGVSLRQKQPHNPFPFGGGYLSD